MLWISLGTALHGQDERFTDRVAVTFVELPVQVLRRGVPIAGLTAEDFIVYDDGETREITTFDVVQVETADDTPTIGAEVEPGEVDPETRSRHYLLFFDFVYSRADTMRRALAGARQMLETQVHASDRVAVATYGFSRGVELLDGFQSNRESTRLALDVIEARISRDRAAVVESTAKLRLVQSDGVPSQATNPGLDLLFRRLGPGAAATIADATSNRNGVPSGFAQQADRFTDEDPNAGNFQIPTAAGTDLQFEPALSRIRRFGLDLAEFATLLRHIPDPKYFVYLSEGIPSFFFRNSALSGRTTRRLKPMIRAFNESGWMLHGIDVSGIPTAREVAFDADGLLFLARETGGEVYENFNRLGQATDRILTKTRITYLLGFQIEDLPRDGSFHSLKVKLRQAPRFVKLFHRPGYYAPKPVGEESSLEQSLDLAELVLDGGELAQINAQLEIDLPGLARHGLQPVLFFAELQASELFDDAPDPFALQVHAYLLDSIGGVQDLSIDQVILETSRMKQQLGEGGVRFGGRLEALPGEYELRVLLHRPDTRQKTLWSRPIELQAADGNRLQIAAPRFYQSDPSWLWLKGTRRNDEHLLANLESMRLAPLPVPQLRAGQTVSLYIETDLSSDLQPTFDAWVVEATTGSPAAGTVELLQRSISADGQTVEGLLGRLTLGALEPGRYTLHTQIAVEDQYLPAERSTTFIVADSTKP